MRLASRLNHPASGARLMATKFKCISLCKPPLQNGWTRIFIPKFQPLKCLLELHARRAAYRMPAVEGCPAVVCVIAAAICCVVRACR
jgi:hypothetical protein